MVIFGPDISSYEHGLNVSALTDPFVMLKCTEGTYYPDPDYPAWLAQAKASKKLVVAYHFCKAESSGAAQATWLAAHIIDTSTPVMLDIETEASSKPGLAKILEIADAMKARGLNVRLAYLPHWYWQEIGSPDLSGLAARGIALVSSAYPNPADHDPVHDYLSDGGDTGPGWAPYGGMTPALWQFTDSGLEQQRLDFNAFRGSVDQLAVLLRAAPALSGGSMTLTQQDAVTIWGYSHGDAPDVHQTLANAAAWSGQANSKLDQVLAQLSVPQVDVTALAAQIVTAIEAHLGTGVDAQAVAVAVQAQLAQALGNHGTG